jgi:hypothetical protein
MTPQEKAIEIYNKFYGIPLYVKTVKQSCYIVIDEILNMDYPSSTFEDLNEHVTYWELVKTEIENI